MLQTEAECGKRTLAGHADGGFGVDAEPYASLGGGQERIYTGSGWEYRDRLRHGEQYRRPASVPNIESEFWVCGLMAGDPAALYGVQLDLTSGAPNRLEDERLGSILMQGTLECGTRSRAPRPRMLTPPEDDHVPCLANVDATRCLVCDLVNVTEHQAPIDRSMIPRAYRLNHEPGKCRALREVTQLTFKLSLRLKCGCGIKGGDGAMVLHTVFSPDKIERSTVDLLRLLVDENMIPKHAITYTCDRREYPIPFRLHAATDAYCRWLLSQV